MENALKRVRNESNTWRITQGRTDRRAASDGSDRSKLGECGRDGSGSTSLNCAGNHLECTGRPESPRTLGVLSGTNPDFPESGGLLLGLGMGWFLMRGSTGDPGCKTSSWGLALAVGSVTDSLTWKFCWHD